MRYGQYSFPKADPDLFYAKNLLKIGFILSIDVFICAKVYKGFACNAHDACGYDIVFIINIIHNVYVLSLFPKLQG